VKAQYEKSIKTYSTPETREMSEFSSTDRNAVQSFIDLTQQGVAIDEALKRVPGLVRTDATVKPDEVGDENYSKLVFSLPLDKVNTNPVRLNETAPWFTLVIRKITPGIPQPFEAVAEQVRLDMAKPEARRRYEEESEKVRDAAGGQPLEEIGKQFGFPVIQLAPVDKNARTLRGDQAQLLVNNPALGELFTLQPGQMTNLFEGDDSRAMYRLDEIVPSYTQTFAEVRGIVHDEYMREQVENAANKAGDDMVAAVKAGTAFPQAAATARYTAIPSFVATREGGANIDPAVLQAAFELKAGDVAKIVGQNRVPWVVRIDKVEPVTPEAAAALRAQIAPRVAQSLQGDIREVFVRGLQAEVEVKRDDVAIRQYLQALAPEDQ
jgi:peptidyl-prolyl cis-trans isomerase D